jgi:two-component system nitrogen regulation sensor histidine kinase NtrY
VDPLVLAQVARTQTALSDYKSLVTRSRALELRFNIILLVVSLLILAISIWVALWLANRLASPIRRLVTAAERVGAGDLSARVSIRQSPDEIGTLARAFNRMTSQLQVQTHQLITANDQLDERRIFTEAVLSGVTAGILSVDRGGRIQLANRSAELLLEMEEGALTGQILADMVPELGQIIDHGQGDTIVQIARGTDTQTLAVKLVEVAGGYVLTFDDISQQLADQRRAAWADVARRIAHEIKNPLTPIQLSAERLQRKYGAQISDDPQTFSRLTGTIVRQVGDLRRMVDEFSSFARMPKPVFRPEPVLDIARQTLFLHEVAHPAISYQVTTGDPPPIFICDRRQIAQALTNLVKNATEAVEARRETDASAGHVCMEITQTGEHLVISVEDDGIGLPRERDRITEPYVTTRARGTGLGLAIVKKIVEEHFGTLEFLDRPGNGTIARMTFDTALLAAEQEDPGGLNDTSEDEMENRRADGA